jgi:adenylate cyclase
MSGGTGQRSQSDSRRVLGAVMLWVLVINAAASILGQAYGDLLRPTGSRSWAAPVEVAILAMGCSFAAFVLLTLKRFRGVLHAPFTLGHVVAVGLVFLLVGNISGVVAPAGDFVHRSRLMTLAIDVPGAVFWMLGISPLAWQRAKAGLLPPLRWLDHNEPPTEDERRALVRLPTAAAVFALPYWVLLAVFNLVLNAWSPLGVDGAVATFFGTLLSWLATAALIYLLTERRLRPFFAEAFRGHPLPEFATAGIRARLLTAWVLGSGIPLFFVIVAPFGLHRSNLLRNPGVVAGVFLFLGAVGVVAGFVTMRIAARSLAEPMQEVRDGLARVKAGDLSVELPIDDAGEVGSVKIGFNEMVAGLRERAILEDLFGRHVGSDVARRAIDEGTALGGEQREVSVFFVDLLGSTGLAETCTPAEVVEILNRFFGAVVASVGAEGGWVNKFEGDGALCVFGTPAEQPDHAERALRAARALSEALKPIADAGIGIASGEVVAGNIGAEERYEYTVIGRPVNTAARLADEAKQRPSRVLAAERAVATAGDEADHWSAVGAVSLRGVQAPVVAFEPLPVAVA